MSTNNKKLHFTVGLSIIIAIGILIALLCTVFTPNYFRPKTIVETYFTDSINGLSPGAPVKFKGVDIGKVTSISLSSEIYPQHHIHLFSPNKSVAVVRMMIYMDQKEVAEQASKLIKEGLRVQTELSGLTGTLYLAANFLDPKLYPPQVESFPWKPQYTYFPATISLTNEILWNIENFLATLENVKSEVVKKLPVDDAHQKSVLQMLTELNTTLSTIDPKQLQNLLQNAENYINTSQSILTKVDVQKINSLLDQLTQTTNRVNSAIKDSQASGLIKEINKTVAGADHTLVSDRYNIRELILRIKDVTDSLNTLSRELNQAGGPIVAPDDSGSPLTAKH